VLNPGGLDRRAIMALIPHQGAMCLLDGARRWSGAEIDCRAVSHLDPANPLRRDGRLAAVCGVEYGMQAAALHGALTGDGRPKPGYIAVLRGLAFHVDRLDDPAFGVLGITARLEQADAAGMRYAFHIDSAAGARLLEGCGLVAFRA
jgi:predicted hotdog family 3-hydroxylacyl-ACP dehydratase